MQSQVMRTPGEAEDMIQSDPDDAAAQVGVGPASRTQLDAIELGVGKWILEGSGNAKRI
jgi:hypothetical protein